MSVAWAGTGSEMSAEKPPSILELVRKARQNQPDSKSGENSEVSELLDKYGATQDRLWSSFISKQENKSEAEVSMKEFPQWKKGVKYMLQQKLELRSDSNKYYQFVKKWGDDPSKGMIKEDHAR